MDTRFLNYLLLFILLVILIIYLLQTTCHTNKKVFNQQLLNTYSQLQNNSNRLLNQRHHSTCNNTNTNTNSLRILGPVIGFHQQFNKTSNNISNTIPELGWRNLYMSNFNNNNEVNKYNNIDPFSSTIIRNYLDNLENVKNIYR